MAITIHRTERPKLIDVPAIESTQGGRRAYTFSLTCSELDNKIQIRTEPNVIEDANRGYDTKHAKDIQMYLYDTDDWVLGAVLLAISPVAIHFQPYQDEMGQPSPVGRLIIYEDDKPLLRLFDGQHRRGAIASLIKENLLGDLERVRAEAAHLHAELNEADNKTEIESAIRRAEEDISELQARYDQFMGDSLTVILYGEGELSEVRQMFSDAAQAKSQEKITRARFDQRDAFNLAAYELWSSSQLLTGKIDMDRDKVSVTSQNLLSFNQLATILKTLWKGYYGRVSRKENAELLSDYSEIVDRGMDFWDEFLPAAIETYDLLLSEELTAEDVPDERQDSYALNTGVLRVLAGCYYSWGDQDRRPLIQFLRKQHFEKGRKRGAILVQAGLVAPGGNTPQARRQEVQAAIRYIVDHAREYQRVTQAV